MARFSWGKGGQRQGQRGRRQHRPANRLHHAHRNQPCRRDCQPAQHRRQRKHDRSGEENLFPSDQIGEAPHGHQQRAIDNRVGIQDPRELHARYCAETALDRGKRNEQHQCIEQHREHGEARHAQNRPR